MQNRTTGPPVVLVSAMEYQVRNASADRRHRDGTASSRARSAGQPADGAGAVFSLESGRPLHGRVPPPVATDFVTSVGVGEVEVKGAGGAVSAERRAVRDCRCVLVRNQQTPLRQGMSPFTVTPDRQSEITKRPTAESPGGWRPVENPAERRTNLHRNGCARLPPSQCQAPPCPRAGTRRCVHAILRIVLPGTPGPRRPSGSAQPPRARWSRAPRRRWRTGPR